MGQGNQLLGVGELRIPPQPPSRPSLRALQQVQIITPCIILIHKLSALCNARIISALHFVIAMSELSIQRPVKIQNCPWSLGLTNKCTSICEIR